VPVASKQINEGNHTGSAIIKSAEGSLIIMKKAIGRRLALKISSRQLC
jgi:hypothetical protein